jgi:hypothetical protein
MTDTANEYDMCYDMDVRSICSDSSYTDNDYDTINSYIDNSISDDELFDLEATMPSVNNHLFNPIGPLDISEIGDNQYYNQIQIYEDYKHQYTILDTSQSETEDYIEPSDASIVDFSLFTNIEGNADWSYNLVDNMCDRVRNNEASRANELYSNFEHIFDNTWKIEKANIIPEVKTPLNGSCPNITTHTHSNHKNIDNDELYTQFENIFDSIWNSPKFNDISDHKLNDQLKDRCFISDSLMTSYSDFGSIMDTLYNEDISDGSYKYTHIFYDHASENTQTNSEFSTRSNSSFSELSHSQKNEDLSIKKLLDMNIKDNKQEISSDIQSTKKMEDDYLILFLIMIFMASELVE